MADNWNEKFERPIPLPDDRELVTLRDAGEFIAELPKRVHDSPPWRLATKELLRAATDQVAWKFFARIAIMHALHGNDPPPIGGKEGAAKTPKWRGRGKRDAWR